MAGFLCAVLFLCSGVGQWLLHPHFSFDSLGFAFVLPSFAILLGFAVNHDNKKVRNRKLFMDCSFLSVGFGQFCMCIPPYYLFVFGVNQGTSIGLMHGLVLSTVFMAIGILIGAVLATHIHNRKGVAYARLV